MRSRNELAATALIAYLIGERHNRRKTRTHRPVKIALTLLAVIIMLWIISHIILVAVIAVVILTVAVHRGTVRRTHPARTAQSKCIPGHIVYERGELPCQDIIREINYV